MFYSGEERWALTIQAHGTNCFDFPMLARELVIIL